MAITELVLLISKVLEAARTIRNKIMNTDVPEADNKDNTSTIEEAPKADEIKTSKEESFKDVVTEPAKAVAYQKIPEKPVMIPEAAAYTKLKKIKAELDNQNNLIFQAEQQRGNLEIELSDLKGFAKITRKVELQRRIDEKTDYINRLKIGLSNMVRNNGFENMNEFYISYKESKITFAEYQQKAEDWEKSYGNTEIEPNKAIVISEKLSKFENDAENSRRYNKQMKDRGAR